MKLLWVAILATGNLFGQWTAVERLPVDSRIELVTGSRDRTKATFVSATGEQVVIRDASGERTVSRADVREVKVAAPDRRVRNGLIGVAVGAAAGAGVGWAICPQCSNEGAGQKYVGPGVAIGAAIGALAFLPSPYRTIYKNK
jgi:hypothetical protein